MDFKSAARALGFALTLSGCLAAASSAQNAPAGGQSQEPPPTPDPGATAQLKCIAENNHYDRTGKTISYMIELENKCDKRMRCEVFVYVLQARGPSSGHAFMILGPKSKGAAAKKTYALKVKEVGGMAQVSRECRVF